MAAVLLLSACDNSKNGSDAYGNFEALDLLVAAESSGKLLAFDLEEGEELISGQYVGQIDTMQLYLKKQQLLAAIRTVRTKFASIDAQGMAQMVQHEILEKELIRIDKLLEDGAATIKQRDDLIGRMEVIEAQVAALETQKSTVSAELQTYKVQVAQVEDQLLRTRVMNPIDGVVLQKYKMAGEIVGAGQNLYKIADLSSLILRVYVSGDQLSSLKIGEEVAVLIDGSEDLEEMTGKITWISSQAEFTPKIIQTREERVTLVYAVKVRVQNDGRLKIGMPGEIKL